MTGPKPTRIASDVMPLAPAEHLRRARAADKEELKGELPYKGVSGGTPNSRLGGAVGQELRERAKDTPSIGDGLKMLTPHDVQNGADPKMRRSPHR